MPGPRERAHASDTDSSPHVLDQQTFHEHLRTLTRHVGGTQSVTFEQSGERVRPSAKATMETSRLTII